MLWVLRFDLILRFARQHALLLLNELVCLMSSENETLAPSDVLYFELLK